MILGLTDDQLNRALERTQADIDASNAVNDRVILEQHIAAIREWKEKKIISLLAQIEEMLSGFSHYPSGRAYTPAYKLVDGQSPSKG